MPKSETENLRFWFLHELRRLRGATRVNGTDTTKEKRALQRQLAGIRRQREKQT